MNKQSQNFTLNLWVIQKWQVDHHIFLQELMATASKLGVSEDLVRHKFIHALPTSIFPVIATQKYLSLPQLGSLADELMPFINEETSHMLSTPSTLSRHNKHSNNKATNVVRPFHDNQRLRVCRWHIYNGERSRTCKSWCKWPDKSNCKVQPTSSRYSLPIPQTPEN